MNWNLFFAMYLLKLHSESVFFNFAVTCSDPDFVMLDSCRYESNAECSCMHLCVYVYVCIYIYIYIYIYTKLAVWGHVVDQ